MLRHAGGELLHAGVMFLHPGENLPDVLPVLFLMAAVFFVKAAVLGNLRIVPGRELGEVSNDPRQPLDPDPHDIQPSAHLGELGRGPVHMLPQDLREPFQG
jgi:hypothetical protein